MTWKGRISYLETGRLMPLPSRSASRPSPWLLLGGAMGDYDDDEKPSWREIDKKRDRSSHVSGGQKKGKKEALQDRWNTGRQKEALDRLFLGDKGTLEHDKLHNNIHKTYGTNRFLGAVQRYIDKFGPPDDVSTLLLLLGTKEVEITLLAMDKLRDIYPTVTPREKEDTRRKLSIIALTEKSAEIKERAAEVVEELKAAT